MPFDRVGFGGGVALALARHHVQELRSAQLADVAQRVHQRLDVVPVHRSDVVEAHLLEQRAGQHHALQMLFRAARQLPHRGHLPQHLLAALAQVRIHASREHAREMVRQRADVLGDRHVVVVEDHEQVRRQRARMVQRLEGEARGHRTVTDHCDHPPVVAGACRRDRHAESRRDRSARMPHPESVVLALRAGREGGEAPVLLDGVQLVAPSSEHLVRVCLVADVPDQPVTRGVEHIVQGGRQLDGAQPGGEMAAARADALDQELA